MLTSATAWLFRASADQRATRPAIGRLYLLPRQRLDTAATAAMHIRAPTSVRGRASWCCRPPCNSKGEVSVLAVTCRIAPGSAQRPEAPSDRGPQEGRNASS